MEAWRLLKDAKYTLRDAYNGKDMLTHVGTVARDARECCTPVGLLCAVFESFEVRIQMQIIKPTATTTLEEFIGHLQDRKSVIDSFARIHLRHP